MTEVKVFAKRNFQNEKFSGVNEGILACREWKDYLFDKFASAECLSVLKHNCWMLDIASTVRDRFEYDTLINATIPLSLDERKMVGMLEASIQKRTERLEKIDSLGRKILSIIKDCSGSGPLNFHDAHTNMTSIAAKE